jgi:hypothetical protein
MLRLARPVAVSPPTATPWWTAPLTSELRIVAPFGQPRKVTPVFRLPRISESSMTPVELTK